MSSNITSSPSFNTILEQSTTQVQQDKENGIQRLMNKVQNIILPGRTPSHLTANIVTPFSNTLTSSGIEALAETNRFMIGNVRRDLENNKSNSAWKNRQLTWVDDKLTFLKKLSGSEKQGNSKSIEDIDANIDRLANEFLSLKKDLHKSYVFTPLVDKIVKATSSKISAQPSFNLKGKIQRLSQRINDKFILLNFQKSLNALQKENNPQKKLEMADELIFQIDEFEKKLSKKTPSIPSKIQECKILKLQCQQLMLKSIETLAKGLSPTFPTKELNSFFHEGVRMDPSTVSNGLEGEEKKSVTLPHQFARDLVGAKFTVNGESLGNGLAPYLMGEKLSASLGEQGIKKVAAIAHQGVYAALTKWLKDNHDVEGNEVQGLKLCMPRNSTTTNGKDVDSIFTPTYDIQMKDGSVTVTTSTTFQFSRIGMLPGEAEEDFFSDLFFKATIVSTIPKDQMSEDIPVENAKLGEVIVTVSNFVVGLDNALKQETNQKVASLERFFDKPFTANEKTILSTAFKTDVKLQNILKDAENSRFMGDSEDRNYILNLLKPMLSSL